ncbi:acetate--CoA ligase family protein [Dactylosporangium roseum]|uniref:Acetate--CoA ligase family protein n=1 Tax=Dactylosporangium roseum TaxID=47989 RepID=A0ABY5YY11_9ACTN|nr:acetate--CoA ligase family protein [Dactylosporangium roseum]UWZ34427.1 acetate--CoA ligase family protein [Dactylosporangium roseum]
MRTTNRLVALDRLFRPRSIAVVGASADETRLGGRLLAYLLAGGFTGEVFAISSSGNDLRGVPGATRVSELPAPPDLVLVCVPAHAVADVVDESARAGAGAAVVLSSGFAELGAAGAEAQHRIRCIAGNAGMPVLGPNAVGIVNMHNSMVASFMRFDTRPASRRPIAVISQSGAVGGGIFNDVQRRGLGAALMCATGNECDVVAADAVEYAVEQDEIQVVILCVEGLREPRRMARVAARAADLGKPIVMLKMGTSEAGARGAQGHTGAIASDDDALRTALRGEGVVFAASPKALVDHAAVLLAGNRPKGNRIGIVTASGGMGIHLADVATSRGLTVPALPSAEQEELRAVLPPFASPINPIDVTAQSINDPAILPQVLERALRSSSYDCLVLYGTNSTRRDEIIETLSRYHSPTGTPLVVAAHDDAAAHDLSVRGVPAVSDPSRALDVVAGLVRYPAPAAAERRRTPSGRKGTIPHRGMLRQADAFLLLQAFDVPTAGFGTATDVETAVKVASSVGFPVALKLDSTTLVHKSDHGGVVLGLADAQAVRAAAAELLEVAASLGMPAELLVQEMVTPDVELFCGVRRDADFGPVLVVGLGGRLVEIVGQAETVMATEPDEHVAAALHRLAGGRLTAHPRGIVPATLPAVVGAMGAVAQLALDHEEVEEVEINPLAIRGTRVVALDVVCRTR